MRTRPLAAVVGVGTELVTGLRVDTNTAEIASALLGAGYRVLETVRLADDIDLVSASLRRLVAECSLVVVTGGLGPTHDDMTREAASEALGTPLVRDQDIEQSLRTYATRHLQAEAREQLLRQADVLEGADVLLPVLGTAPGQTVATGQGRLVLLPGPPHEMRPMLDMLLAAEKLAVPPRRLRCAGITESDAQVIAQRELAAHDGVELTVLASPAEVEVVLFDDGIGAEGLESVAASVADALGDTCYSRDGSSLAEVVVRTARQAGLLLATAESCTGGMVASAMTDVPGASDVFVGGVVSYSNAAKSDVLGVDEHIISSYGAVSSETAAQMAEGAASLFRADLAISITGIAGPDGGTADKPVGTVWFGLVSANGQRTWKRELLGDRAGVRLRATVHALDTLRREIGVG